MFELPEALRTGIRVVDLQHSELLALLETFKALKLVITRPEYADLTSRQGPLNQTEAKWLESFDGLVEYAEYHFVTEESFFDTFNYPESASHKREHRLFAEKIKAFQELRASKSVLEYQEALIDFLEKWIITHIQKSDMRYADFIKPKLKAES